MPASRAAADSRTAALWGIVTRTSFVGSPGLGVGEDLRCSPGLSASPCAIDRRARDEAETPALRAAVIRLAFKSSPKATVNEPAGFPIPVWAPAHRGRRPSHSFTGIARRLAPRGRLSIRRVEASLGTCRLRPRAPLAARNAPGRPPRGRRERQREPVQRLDAKANAPVAEHHGGVFREVGPVAQNVKGALTDRERGRGGTQVYKNPLPQHPPEHRRCIALFRRCL